MDFAQNLDALSRIAATARRHPHTRFVLIDHSVHQGVTFPANVTGMPFDSRELGYLAGYLSALEAGHPKAVIRLSCRRLQTPSGIPAVTQLLAGFRAGALRAEPSGRVIIRYSGTFLVQPPCEAPANREIDAGRRLCSMSQGRAGSGRSTPPT